MTREQIEFFLKDEERAVLTLSTIISRDKKFHKTCDSSGIEVIVCGLFLYMWDAAGILFRKFGKNPTIIFNPKMKKNLPPKPRGFACL